MTIPAFFDEFHRRHPDIPIVLLPPDGPAEPMAHVDQAVATDRARLAGARVVEQLAGAWTALAPGLTVPATVDLGWAPVRPGVARAEASLRSPGPVPALLESVESIAQALTGDGRATAPGVAQRGNQVTVTRDDLVVEVVVWGPDGPWDVTVATTVELGDLAAPLCGRPPQVRPWPTGGSVR